MTTPPRHNHHHPRYVSKSVRADPHGVAEELSELMGAADEVDELGDADAVGGALHTLLSL